MTSVLKRTLFISLVAVSFLIVLFAAGSFSSRVKAESAPAPSAPTNDLPPEFKEGAPAAATEAAPAQIPPPQDLPSPDLNPPANAKPTENVKASPPPANLQNLIQPVNFDGMPVPKSPNTQATAGETQPGEDSSLEKRRDPFAPYFSNVSDETGTSKQAISSTGQVGVADANILLNFGVEEFVLTAVLWQVADPKVIIKDPKGSLHTLRKDNRIGKNNGFIAEIREGEIVVVEPSIDRNGMASAQTKVLSLSKK